MSIGDFGALCFFKIHNNPSKRTMGTSKSVGTHYSADRYTGWKTTYYDASGHKVGTSNSSGTQYSYGGYGGWETTYYDASGSKVGRSISMGTNYSSRCYGSWKTTYYDSFESKIGTSNSTGTNFSFDGYGGWETDCYDVSGYKISTSNSAGTDYAAGSYGGWQTTYYSTGGSNYAASPYPEWETNYPSAITVAKKHVSVREIYKRPEAQRDIHNSSLRIQNDASIKKLNAIESPNYYQLKEYYLSQAGFFNACSDIFKECNDEAAIRRMRERAEKNPGGASEKTLHYFNLG